MDVKNVSIDLFPVNHVLLAGKTAIVTRQGVLEVPAGNNQFVISKLTRQLNKESMHITILETGSKKAVSLQNPVVRKIQPAHIPPPEVADLQGQLDGIRKQLTKIDHQLSLISQKRATTTDFLTKAGKEFLTYYAEKAGKVDPFVNLVNFVESFTDTRQEEIKLNRERKILEQEEGKITSQLEKLQEKRDVDYHELVFSLIASKPAKIKLQMRYRVPAKWKPSYDLKITEDTSDHRVEILFWGIIENQSEENWENVNLELGLFSLGEVSVEHPAPLPLERGTEGTLDLNFQKFGVGTDQPVVKGQTTESLVPMSEKISVPADEDTHAYLLHSFTSSAGIFHYWNAAETDHIIMGVKFTNGDIDLLAGDCSFFKDERIIGRGKLPDLISYQEIQLPLTAESLVIATKRLMKQDNPEPKRFLLNYKLHLVNKRQSPVKIDVVDILPISKQPRSEIRLLKSKPNPAQTEKGLLRWEVDLVEEWEVLYTVEIKGQQAIQS